MYFKYKILCDTLNQYEKIIIYGAGNYALKVYPYLVQYGIKEKIVCFAQTCGDIDNWIDGIPINSIDNIECNKVECVVLIAVSELYAQQIKWTLIGYNFMNIIAMIDYQIDSIKAEKEIRQLKSFEEYCAYITDWYVQVRNPQAVSKIIFQNLIERGKYVNQEKNSNLIVVVCGHLSVRTIKIISALKRKEYNIVVLEYSTGVNPWCWEKLQDIDVQAEYCENIEEIMYKMLQYSPLVYFWEPRWGDCLWTEIILKKKEYFGKVVLDLYDVMNDGGIVRNESNLATEKFALEHSDGIVWRWFSKECLEKKGFIFSGKSIQFVDYCSNENTYIDTNYDQSAVIKLCAGDGYGDICVDERKYTTKYTDYARIGEILSKVGNRPDCIFHYYVGYLSEENIERCEEYQREYKNFKFFLGTKYDDLLRRFQMYDYGCELWTSGEVASDDMFIGKYAGSNYRDCVRNIFFDFIEAGLPIITTAASRLWEFLSAYDIVIRMTLSDLDLDYLKQHKEYYKTNVQKARRELNINNQIPKLIQFFKEV